MKLPKNPTIKSPIVKWAADVVAWMRANTIHNVIGGKLRRTPNGITIDVTQSRGESQRSSTHPWLLLTRDNSGTLEWKVARQEGTITDGTNGASIDLASAGFDAWNSISATKYIALEASVSTSHVLSSWTVSAVDAADALEVGFDVSGDVQDTIRLVIGKVTISAGAISHTQIAKDHQRVDYGFLNGVLVKVFNIQAINPAAV